MRILDKNILQSIVTIFIASVLVFCFIYILIDITSTLDEIIDRGIPFKILVQYYSAFLPIIIVQTSPVACLIATLFTFGNLNNHNEIIAMRASGLTFWQITKPALYFGMIISACIFLLSERVVPKATQTTQKIWEDNMVLLVDRINKNKNNIKNMTFYGLKNRLYFIDTFDPKKKELHGITIIEHDSNQNIKQKILALKGVWTGLAWKFYQCQITTYEPGRVNMPKKVRIFDEKLMDIEETPSDFNKQRVKVASMNILQLRDYIHKFEGSGAKKAINNFRVDLHQKIAQPFSNFIIILVGLPFGIIIKARKRTTFASLGIAIMIGFLYYVIDAVCIALGKGGVFPPIISAWLSSAIFAIIAISVIENNF